MKILKNKVFRFTTLALVVSFLSITGMDLAKSVKAAEASNEVSLISIAAPASEDKESNKKNPENSGGAQKPDTGSSRKP